MSSATPPSSTDNLTEAPKVSSYFMNFSIPCLFFASPLSLNLFVSRWGSGMVKAVYIFSNSAILPTFSLFCDTVHPLNEIEISSSSNETLFQFCMIIDPEVKYGAIFETNIQVNYDWKAPVRIINSLLFATNFY